MGSRLQLSFKAVHLCLQDMLPILDGNHLLINLLVLDGELLLLLLLLLQVFVCLDYVVLGDFAEDLEFVEEASLAVHQLPLLIQLHSEGVDLVLLVSVLDLYGLLDLGFCLLSLFDMYFFRGDHLSERL